MVLRNIKKHSKLALTEHQRKQAILNRAKKNKDIVFGARSIEKQIGTSFARPTEDYDIFTKKPKQAATQMEAKLDNLIGFDYHFVKKGKNPGTWKVKGRGQDFRKGTKDDVGVVDFTKTPSPAPKSKKIQGVRFRKLSEEIKAKRKVIKDPMFAFRKEKDMEDLMKINSARSMFRF